MKRKNLFLFLSRNKKDDQVGINGEPYLLFLGPFSPSPTDAYRLQRATTLTDEEILNIRDADKRHCKEILNECRDEYPGEPEIQIAVFDKRCDKIFSWIQQARDQKIREQRTTTA